MNELLITGAGCFVLGFLTTIHPCPMTANITAISFLSGTSGSKKKSFSSLFFVMGYLIALSGIAVLLNIGLISIPKLSVYLQSIVSAFLGPMLILVGMVLSELIRTPFIGMRSNKSFLKNNFIYVFLMGAFLALSFCPATAFIYFGLLIPLSVSSEQLILFPILYGVGALLPIIGVSILINRGFSAFLHEKWIRRMPMIAGWLLIMIGIYLTLGELYF